VTQGGRGRRLSIDVVAWNRAADKIALSLIEGVPWPEATTFDLTSPHASGLPTSAYAEGLAVRLARATARYRSGGRAVQSRRRRTPPDLIVIGAAGKSHYRAAARLTGFTTPVLIASSKSITSGVAVIQGRFPPALYRLLVASPFRDSRIHAVGVIDVQLPWYVGLGFAAEELGELLATRERAARARIEPVAHNFALRLNRANVACSARIEVGNPVRIVARVVEEAAADWVLVGRRRKDDRALGRLIEAAISTRPCSILVSPTLS
jgi:nucleotide-binding universal stress UspA family protein